jgi:uncharacterized RDD family membrane protein YckC
MESKNAVITLAKPSRRLFAFLLDFVFAFIMGISIFLAISQPVILKNLGYAQNLSNSYKFLEDCGFGEARKFDNADLYSSFHFYFPNEKEEDNRFNAVTKDGSFGYLAYQDILITFYNEFLPTTSYVLPSKGGEAYYQKSVLNLSLTSSPDGNYGNPYFMPGKDADGNLSYNAKPVLLPDAQEALNTNKESQAKVLLNYFYSASGDTGLFNKAILFAESSASYHGFVDFANQALVIAAIPAILIPIAVFAILIPLSFPNGETLGKKIFGLCLINRKGFRVEKWRVAFRGVFFLLMGGLVLIPGFTIGMAMGVTMFLVIDYMIMFASPQRNTFQDWMAGTLVISGKASRWFRNEDAEKNFTKTHPEYVEVDAVDVAEEELPIEGEKVEETPQEKPEEK